MTRVLLYSGGLDSACAAWIWKPDVLVYVRTGAPYEDYELKGIRKLTRWKSLVVVEGPHLRQWQGQGGIVPQRNAYLCLMAAHHGDEIALASVRGDRGNDKDAEFMHRMNALLQHMWAPQWWTPGESKRVVMPVAHMAKGELVAAALREGMPLADARAAPSCYAGTDCGECKACVRKWIALRAAGIDWYPRVDGTATCPRKMLTPAAVEQMEAEYDSARVAELRHALRIGSATNMYATAAKDCHAD